MLEAEVTKLDGMMLMMEKQKLSMETQLNNANVFQTMSEGTKAVQELAKEADIDKFDEIREMHEELEDKNSEVNDFFKNYAEDQTADCEDELADLEAELEAELGEMELGDIDLEDSPIVEKKSKNKISTKEKAKRDEESLLAELN